MEGIKVFRTVKTIYHGSGSRAKLRDLAEGFNAGKILILTDQGVRMAGIVDPIAVDLKGCGFSVEIYDLIKPEPTVQDIEYAAREANLKCHMLVGIGGGSTMDSMKALSLMISNQCSFSALKGMLDENRPVKNDFPRVAMPTTAGTGSEVTTAAVFIDTVRKVKQALLNPALLPEAAIVDPELTLKLPPHVTAATGMDALIHAMEAYTSRMATDLTDSIAERAIQLIAKNLITAFTNGSDIRAREALSVGSLLAGMAVENAGTTAVHSLAFAVSGRYGLPHGVATSMLTPEVFEFNLSGNMEKYAKMGWLMSDGLSRAPGYDAAAATVAIIRDMIRDLNLPGSFRELKINPGEEDTGYLAESAGLVRRPLANNPRPIAIDDIREIFKRLSV